MKQLTIMEYIKYFELKISRQGILWRINNKKELEYVSKIDLIGKSYILTIKE